MSGLGRREFLRLGGVLLPGALLGSTFASLGCDLRIGGVGPYGPLGEPDENGIQLPAGFQSRVVARAGVLVPGTSYEWHPFPDGGAVFPTTDAGWVYVSNSEVPVDGGGAGALRFDAEANVVDAYRICTGTSSNCAGGATPWGTWLSCEEYPRGTVWECDPLVPDSQVRRRELGVFAHEAVAVDPERGHLYLTEDVPDGRLYRFTPNAFGNLESGVLEVAQVLPQGGRVAWHALPNPTPRNPTNNPTRHQVPESTPFDGGEGIVYSGGHVFFTTKGDNRVWEYDPQRRVLCLIYDASVDPVRQLTGVDNIAASAGGDYVVAEDGGNMELVVLTPEREAAPILRVVGQDASELAGPAFDPSGQRLYVSSQRGDGFGITYEITGPFRS